jgi:hypothetical protein
LRPAICDSQADVQGLELVEVAQAEPIKAERWDFTIRNS